MYLLDHSELPTDKAANVRGTGSSLEIQILPY